MFNARRARMDTRIAKLKKLAALAFSAALIMLSIVALSSQFILAEDNNGDKPEITIEVVEEIPAAEIEEQEVPLADTPMTAAADNTRNMVVAWTFGVVIIAYMVFLISGMRLRKNRRIMQGGTAGDRDNGAEER
jgi:hypothetical protein